MQCVTFLTKHVIKMQDITCTFVHFSSCVVVYFIMQPLVFSQIDDRFSLFVFIRMLRNKIHMFVFCNEFIFKLQLFQYRASLLNHLFSSFILPLHIV